VGPFVLAPSIQEVGKYTKNKKSIAKVNFGLWNVDKVSVGLWNVDTAKNVVMLIDKPSLGPSLRGS